MKKLLLLLLLSLSLSAFSDTNRIVKNKNFSYQFILPNNLCVVKSSDAQIYIFDRDTLKNRVSADRKKPDLINGRNIYGEVSVFKNIEFIDNSLDSYLEDLAGQLNKWTKNYKYKTWTLIQATKVEINKHEYIKEYHTLNLNKLGNKEYQLIKEFISDEFNIEPIAPDDIINIILIKSVKDGLQYGFHLSFRDEVVDEVYIENIINSFQLTPIQDELKMSNTNINC